MQTKLFNTDGYVDPYKAAGSYLQYPGSKRKIAAWIASYFPQQIEHYYEPFVGGGGMFWHVRKNKMALAYTISDLSPIIYCHYIVLRDHFQGLLEFSKEIQEKHNYHYFFEARERLQELKRAGIYTVETASLDMYNKRMSLYSTGYSPQNFGNDDYIIDYDKLRSCNTLLQDVRILSVDYAESITYPRSGALIYCDPPYSGTRQDVYETPGKWTYRDDNRLYNNICCWVDSGADVIVSSMLRGKETARENTFAKLTSVLGMKVYQKVAVHTWGKLPQSEREEVREIIFVGSGRDR